MLSARMLAALAVSALFLTASSARADFLDPIPNVGQAGGYTVLGLTNTVNNTGGTSTVTGDVGVGPGGELDMQGGSKVTGTVFVDQTGNVVLGGGSTVGGTVVQSMSQAVSDAIAASTAFAAATPNQTIAAATVNAGGTSFSNPGGTEIVKITGNVDLEGSHTLTFTGAANDHYVVDVTGGLKLGGSSKILLSGGITPSDLIFNIEENNASVNGVDIESGAHAVGTFLAPFTSATVHGGSLLDPALTGAVIAGGNTINIQSTAYITGAPTPPVPAPSSAVSLIGMACVAAIGFQATRRRRGIYANCATLPV